MDATLRECVTKDVGDGSYEKPIAMLREELLRHPEDVEAKMMLGVCCQMAGEDDDCLRIYEEVRPQMELRESAGEDSEVVSFWRKYRGLVAALLMVGVIPFCGCGTTTVKGSDQAAVQEGGRVFETDMQKAANDPSIAKMAKKDPDGVQMFIGDDGDLIWISTGTCGYDPTDEGVVAAARKEATNYARRNILRYLNANFSTEEKAMEAVKKAKIVNSCGKGGQGAINRGRIKMAVRAIGINPYQGLREIVVLKNQVPSSPEQLGSISVTVGFRAKDLKAEPEVYTKYGGPEFERPRPMTKYGGPKFDF